MSLTPDVIPEKTGIGPGRLGIFVLLCESRKFLFCLFFLLFTTSRILVLISNFIYRMVPVFQLPFFSFPIFFQNLLPESLHLLCRIFYCLCCQPQSPLVISFFLRDLPQPVTFCPWHSF